MPYTVRLLILLSLNTSMMFYAAGSYAQGLESDTQAAVKDIKADVAKTDQKADEALKQLEQAKKDSDSAAQKTADQQAELSSQATTTVATVATLQTLLDAQKNQLEAQQQALKLQSEQIAKQNQLLLDLQKQLNAVAKTQAEYAQPMQAQQEKIDSQTTALAGLKTEIDSVKQKQTEQSNEPTAQEVALNERIASLENTVDAIPSDPSTLMGMESFPGSIRIPGSNAAIKFGGFVKVDAAKSFAPLASQDRFIVGSIPIGSENDDIQQDTSLTANQSRFNVDVREHTSLGQFRAFIEGDFGGANNTFRLRHAYGQFRDVLAGQTWTTFYDPQAAPEEADFEGISGQVLLRQAQVRWFPSIGKDWDLQIALEDPQPEVSDYCNQDAQNCPEFGGEIASGASNIPDTVVSIRRNWLDRYHIKFAALARQIRATSTYDAATNTYNSLTSTTAETSGWGVTASGVIKAGWWGESDNIKFQITGGKGIGRYTNDPNTIGGLDAVFDAEGNIYALPLFAGFVAYEHWWSSKGRSTFLLSFVDIDNYEFQPDAAYKAVRRASVNYFWSPIHRVDFGAEMLWGQRINKDGARGDASQIQLITKYRF